MRRILVLASITALIAVYATVNAQGLFGFRLLKLDGEHVIWSTWTGEPKLAKVTYAFVRSRTETPDAINCGAMGPIDTLLESSGLDRQHFRGEVRAAFDMWESVANITFTEIDDPGKAGILIGTQLEPEGRAFANVSYRPDETQPRSIERSLVCFNPEQRWKIGFDGNLAVYDIRYTTAHEIGHAIGLDHPVSAGQLMHYRYEERFRALQPGDIEGAVLLYGLRQPPAEAAPETRSAGFTAAAVRE
ncbi:MAG: matrixin family metalloprotease [Hyphomicrobiaceae bacterium]|nr:matrixin family metalloprotease [Hyphomicrobiaceae bacterium]